MPLTQHLSPIILDDNAVVGLEREPLDTTVRHTELKIQALVHGTPNIIPMDEIEPAYNDMISLCTELPLSSGFLDNLWMTPRGGIVIGECKLFRNPQARREVIAQALDYARSLQRMNYEAFEAAISKARSTPDFRLWECVTADQPESDVIPETTFIDGVSRRLREAQLMILIIGDGIREDLENLTDFLQLHAGLHANLALLDLSLWKLPDGRRLVIPRLPMKTVTIERGIVRLDETLSELRVAPDQIVGRSRDTAPNRAPKTGSAKEFLAMLRQNDPASAKVLENLFEMIPDTGIDVRFSPQYAIFEVSFLPKSRTVFDVKYTGEIWGGTIVGSESDSEIADIVRPLLADLAEAMLGRLSFTPQNNHRLRTKDDRRLRVSDFLGQEAQVADALRKIGSVCLERQASH